MRNKLGDFLATTIATWFGCGFSPFAPGTVGSAGAMIPAVLLIQYAGLPPWYFALLSLVLLAPGIWAAHWVAWERKTKDPGLVVVDEVLGQWVTLAGVTAFNWKSALAAFLLFRFLDIWKPAPARQSEALPGGYGIVADDIIAGIYGALVLFVAGWFNLY